MMDYEVNYEGNTVIVLKDGIEKFRYTLVNPVVPQLIRIILQLMEERK